MYYTIKAFNMNKSNDFHIQKFDMIGTMLNYNICCQLQDGAIENTTDINRARKRYY